MNKNTSKAIKVVKKYMKRTGAKIICGEWGTPECGCFLTLYLAAHGHKSDFLTKAENYWGYPMHLFIVGFDGSPLTDMGEIAEAGAQARAAFKKELGL